MTKTWKPVAGGILSIVAGVLELLIGLGLLIRGEFARRLLLHLDGAGIGIVLIILAVIAIIGGIFALSRRTWVLALVGSIGALFPPPFISLLGIPAIILVSMSKREFNHLPSTKPPDYSEDNPNI